jgi:glucokinase
MFESRDPAAARIEPFPRLLADIGGTNARFGWQDSLQSEVGRVRVLPCAEHASLKDAVERYLQHEGLAAPPCAAFGIACPVTGDAIAMTNHHWRFSVGELRAALGLRRLLFINDFAALAMALPTLPTSVLHPVGGGGADPAAAVGLIGPGTGLGVSGLLPGGRASTWIPISGEGGHVTLPVTTADEFTVIARLQKRFGHVSAERVLCGAGLVDLYHALGDVRGDRSHEITAPAQVLARAHDQADTVAIDTVEMFCAFLGSVAGDLALTLGARGGIYIGGGIVPRLGEGFARSAFRERFEHKGRYRSYLQRIPTVVIRSPVSPALDGASLALSMSES